MIAPSVLTRPAKECLSSCQTISRKRRLRYGKCGNVQSDTEKQILQAPRGSAATKEVLLILVSLFSPSSVRLIIAQQKKERCGINEDMRKLLGKGHLASDDYNAYASFKITLVAT